MRGLPWLRLWTSAAHHPKIGRLSEKLQARWWRLLCISAENGGVLPADLQNLAYLLRLSDEETKSTIDALLDARLLDRDADGVLAPHDWPDWQRQYDSSTERSVRHRAKKKIAQGSSATLPSGDATLQPLQVIDEQVLRNGPEQEGEADNTQSKAEAPRTSIEEAISGEIEKITGGRCSPAFTRTLISKTEERGAVPMVTLRWVQSYAGRRDIRSAGFFESAIDDLHGWIKCNRMAAEALTLQWEAEQRRN